MQELEEDIGNLLIRAELTLGEEEAGVVEVDEVVIGEDTRIIVIIKVLLLRFLPFEQTVHYLAERYRYVYLDLHVFNNVRDV